MIPDWIKSAFDTVQRWVTFIVGYAVGQNVEREKSERRNASIKDDQLQQAAKPRPSVAGLLERMRRNKL